MKYADIFVYTQHAEAIYLLHMRVEVLRTREITSVVCGRNAEIASKMADYRALVSIWERYTIIRKMPN